MRTLLLCLVLTAACSSAAPTPAPAPMAAPTAGPRAATAATAAVAPAPAPRPALNAVGAYSFATDVNGTPVAGTLTITQTNGVWGGRLTSDVFPEIPVTAVVVEGQVLKVTAEAPNGSAQIVMNFTGDDYTGTWELGGLQGPVSGKRIK